MGKLVTAFSVATQKWMDMLICLFAPLVPTTTHLTIYVAGASLSGSFKRFTSVVSLWVNLKHVTVTTRELYVCMCQK